MNKLVISIQMKKINGVEPHIIKATYLNHTNTPTSNRGGNYMTEITEIVTTETLNEIQERANQILKERRFISKADAATILGCSIRTIERQITNDFYTIHEDKKGTVRINKDSFYMCFGLK